MHVLTRLVGVGVVANQAINKLKQLRLKEKSQQNEEKGDGKSQQNEESVNEENGDGKSQQTHGPVWQA